LKKQLFYLNKQFRLFDLQYILKLNCINRFWFFNIIYLDIQKVNSLIIKNQNLNPYNNIDYPTNDIPKTKINNLLYYNYIFLLGEIQEIQPEKLRYKPSVIFLNKKLTNSQRLATQLLRGGNYLNTYQSLCSSFFIIMTFIIPRIKTNHSLPSYYSFLHDKLLFKLFTNKFISSYNLNFSLD